MKKLSLAVLVVSCFQVFAGAAVSPAPTVTAIIDEYIEEWKQFNPSRARSRGFVDAIKGFEDLSSSAIAAWVEYNQVTLRRLEALSGRARRMTLRSTGGFCARSDPTPSWTGGRWTSPTSDH